MIKANQSTRAIGNRLFGVLDGFDGVDMFLLMSFWHNDEGIRSQRRYPGPSGARHECVAFANLADWFVEVLPRGNI